MNKKQIRQIARRFAPKQKDFDIVLCVSCVHKYDTGAFCKAFPEGIPEIILSGKFKHTKPFKGDRGLRYNYGNI